MLAYLGQGLRDYAAVPVRAGQRPWWEFQAVLAGRIAPLVPGADGGPPRADRLWVFPARANHGWTGVPGAAARVAVFHFTYAPEPLPALVPQRGWFESILTPVDGRTLDGWLVEAAATIATPRRHDPLRLLRILASLAELACRDLPSRDLAAGAEGDRRRARLARAWYREHLAEQPSVAEVATALGFSPAHLRRIFHAAEGASPGSALREVQWQRARELLADSNLTLAAIAERSGFRSLEVFSRAFRRHFGEAPGRWRRQLKQPRLRSG